jgi:rhodanese-related sulfurtransferase
MLAAFDLEERFVCMEAQDATTTRSQRPETNGESMIPAVTPQQVQQLIAAGTAVDLIDVRSPEEFARGHAVGARSVPLNLLDPRAVVATRTSPADQPIYLICQSGGRSAQACMLFQAAGIDLVRNVTGGTGAWIASGLPAVRTP